jgi:hypothetical protein
VPKCSTTAGPWGVPMPSRTPYLDGLDDEFGKVPDEFIEH